MNSVIFSRCSIKLCRKRKHGVLGLGLVICKMIVETLGGDIWIESKLGEGSVFYCTVSKGNRK